MASKKGEKKSSAPVVTVMQVHTKDRFAALSRINRKWLLAAAFVVIVFLVVGALWLNRGSTSSATSLSNKEYAASRVGEQKAVKLPPTATTQTKISLRLSIAENEFRAEQYDAALTDYQLAQKMAAGTPYETQQMYILGGTIYAKLGNKVAAGQAFDKAKAIVEKISNPDLRQMSLSDVQSARESAL